LRLARYFGTSAEMWMTLQAKYDLAMAEDALGGRIEKEVLPRAAA
jgi:plasmid maintenance system antidote protein VapI